MKLRTFMLGACLSVSALQLSAQNDPASNIDRFSYSYGVLLGKSFNMQGLQLQDIKMEDLVKGVQAMMQGKDLLIDEKTAQNEVNARLQTAQAAKEKVMIDKEKTFFTENAKKPGMQTLANGMQYEVLTQGTGAKPTISNKVKAHYHGTLLDGTVFDSSVERGQAFSFQLNGVIRGWQEIIPMMPIGSKWRVYIPYAMAYGARGAGKIPPYATLIFEIELLGIE